MKWHCVCKCNIIHKKLQFIQPNINHKHIYCVYLFIQNGEWGNKVYYTLAKHNHHFIPVIAVYSNFLTKFAQISSKHYNRFI